MAIENLKKYKSSDIDQIATELIKLAGRTIHSETQNLINSIWNNEELHEE